MKKLYKPIITLLSAVLLFTGYNGFSQGATKGDVSLGVNYFIVNNQVPYLLVRAKSKIDGKFQPVVGITIKLFLDKDSTGTLIGNVITNDKGEASTIIPATVKAEWATTAKHTFLATFAGNKKFESAKGDLTMSRAKILIDVSSDKKITASVFELKDAAWIPVKAIDVKIGVKRQGADLPVNEKPTFTTDSTGTVAADFKRDSIPGDAKGNITLVARIDDNDTYGNLVIEKTVPWGAKFAPVSTFNERSLFGTRDKTPIWLLVMAYSILIVVWGILISLVRSIFKIKKLGDVAI
jgi:hypothetical protein